MLLLLTVATAAITAGAACASSVRIERATLAAGTKPFSATVMRWVAAPGERNELTATVGSGVATLRDAAGPIEHGPECRTGVDGTVVCSGDYLKIEAGDGDDVLTVAAVAYMGLLGIEAGDGDDRVTVEGEAVVGGQELDSMGGFSGIAGGAGNDAIALGRQAGSADGGPGADVLAGGSGDDGLEGGAGEDRLAGGDGDDELEGGDGVDAIDGGAGDDELYGGSWFRPGDPAPDRLAGGAGDDELDGDAGDDVLDGGEGADTVSFEDRRRPVTVDLLAGVAGGEGERDALSGIEHARGGYGPDTLIGDDGPNRLHGGVSSGKALPLDARLGNPLRRGDVIDGNGGDDLVSGGAAAGFPGRVRCGAGVDRAGELNRGDRIAADCEDIAARGVLLSARRSGPRTLTLALARDQDDRAPRDPACGVFLRLTGPGPAVDRAVPVRVPRRGVVSTRYRPRHALGPRVGVTLHAAVCPANGPLRRRRGHAGVSFLLELPPRPVR